jgi:hypothetical protein
MEPCETTRRIILYCREALDEIRRDEPTGALWERRWVSLMAMLRTAAETLRKEAPTQWGELKSHNAHIKSPRGRDVKTLWSPDIFGRFIWSDANLFLHQGKVTANHHGTAVFHDLPGRAVSGPLPNLINAYYATDDYAGRDALVVAHEAIDWLTEQAAAAESRK